MYNAAEIFQIGIEIEKNGKKFYKLAAEKTDDEDSRKLFLELADWEQGHVVLFENLKSDLAKQEGNTNMLDPDEEVERYLKASADTHVFNINADMDSLVNSCNTPQDILNLALRFEKDSVVVYTAMKDRVVESMGKEKVNKLINEEMLHVAFITKQLEILG
ncbi:MAG: rubrerythrin [Chitinivibrionales bacterium]|nr:rubrerythrin [Chitinivibrionales bacterium]